MKKIFLLSFFSFLVFSTVNAESSEAPELDQADLFKALGDAQRGAPNAGDGTMPENDLNQQLEEEEKMIKTEEGEIKKMEEELQQRRNNISERRTKAKEARERWKNLSTEEKRNYLEKVKSTRLDYREERSDARSTYKTERKSDRNTFKEDMRNAEGGEDRKSDRQDFREGRKEDRDAVRREIPGGILQLLRKRRGGGDSTNDGAGTENTFNRPSRRRPDFGTDANLDSNGNVEEDNSSDESTGRRSNIRDRILQRRNSSSDRTDRLSNRSDRFSNRSDRAEENGNTRRSNVYNRISQKYGRRSTNTEQRTKKLERRGRTLLSPYHRNKARQEAEASGTTE